MLWVTPFEFRDESDICKKTKDSSIGLFVSEEIMFVLIQYQITSDGQRDRWTDGQTDISALATPVLA